MRLFLVALLMLACLGCKENDPDDAPEASDPFFVERPSMDCDGLASAVDDLSRSVRDIDFATSSLRSATIGLSIDISNLESQTGDMVFSDDEVESHVGDIENEIGTLQRLLSDVEGYASDCQ